MIRGKSLSDLVGSGILWNAGGRFALRIGQFLVSVLLVRLLSPEKFGLISMILVFLGVADLLNEQGFRGAIVQRAELTERHLSSVWWLTLGLGAAWTAIGVLLAPAIAWFYDEPQLEAIARLLSLRFVINGLCLVPLARLERTMRFRALTVQQLVSAVVSGGVAIGLAWAGYGVWSLAWYSLLQPATLAVHVWVLREWRPRLLFDRSAVRELFGFSSGVLVFNLVNYPLRNLDDFLIGRCFGATSLGLYQRGYATMTLPLAQVTASAGATMFPVLSQAQHDRELVKRLYLRSLGGVALAAFPLMLGLLVVADPFVVAVYGMPWRPIVPLLRVFCLVGAVQAIGSTGGWLFLSQGRAGLQVRMAMVVGAFVLPAIGLGVALGSSHAVAVSYGIASSVAMIPVLSVAGGLVGVRLGEIGRAVAGPLGAALIMTAATWGIGRALPPGWPAGAVLIALVAAGALVYWAVVHALRLESYRTICQLLRKRLGLVPGEERNA